MTFPAGLVTRTLTVQAPFSEDGSPVDVELIVTASRPLVWAATGTPMLPTRRVHALGSGASISLDLPITTQTGWLSNGAPVAGSSTQHTHTYSATLTYRDPKTGRTDVRHIPSFVLPSGSPVAVEALAVWTGGTSGPVYVPDVWGVLDQTKATAAAAQASASAAQTSAAGAATAAAAAVQPQVQAAKDAATAAAASADAAASALTGGSTDTAVLAHHPLFLSVDARTTSYTYSGGLLSTITEKSGSTTVKTTTIGYSAGQPSTITETAGGHTVTTTLGYSGGNLSTITRSAT